MSKQYQHTTVLLDEAVKVLNLKPDGIYLDGTFGRGGHSRLILSQLGKQGRLIAIDRDQEAVKEAQTINDPRFDIIHGPFSNLIEYINKLDLLGKVNGVLLDLGVSSPQIDNPERGFSFMHDGPLDMRMDTTSGQSAEEWLKRASVESVTWVLKNFGEERFAKRIAHAIVQRNRKQPMTRTCELTALIARTHPFRDKYKHTATRTFQAIRIYVNNELQELKQALEGTLAVLTTGGRLSVISFHSLEDRLVKNVIYHYSNRPQIPFGLPLTETQINLQYNNRLKLKVLGKLQPSKKEIINNPRARSSVLRFAEKL